MIDEKNRTVMVSFLFVVISLFAFEASAVSDHSIMEFPRLAGVTDDAPRGELIIRVVGQNGENFGERKISGVDATQIEVGAVESNNPFSLVFVSSGGAKLYSFWMGGVE